MTTAHEAMDLAAGPPETPDQRPMHERITADLREEILSGTTPPGTVLRHADLTQRLGADDTTVHRALRNLQDEHLTAPHADGEMVVGHHRQTMRPAQGMSPVGPSEPFPWLVEVRRRGIDARFTLLEVEVLPEPPARIVEALQLADGQRAVLGHLLLTFDGKPAALIKVYFAYDIVDGTLITGRRLIRGGIPSLLSHLGYPALRCVDLVTAQTPTQEQNTILRLPETVPLLRTFRVAYSTGDRPVIVTDAVEAAHLFELQYEFSPASPR
ncbi:GntR family transcriptional regulator [Streptomyces griseochromogenes]|uniref:GntR family transcriptional regulator n=2 Tax=Streptomyces griseochromogenes TaxID=68214 RepID=A0ABS4MB89_9ACTN|nr:GntR family transcriptional regulator [Streptomyces griseochromogenes]MBP2056641.1 GntR family transcriptional regulator [Streptomyces griseochromogenes]